MLTKSLLSFAALVLAASTSAGEHRYPLSPAYVAECGSCHVAYPPALMTAPAWAATLRGLERHFGTDASLEPKAQREIAALLEAQASTRSKHQPAGQVPRLTETPWFQKEHRSGELREHEVSPAAGTKRASLSQCNTCHRRAEQGDFSEGSLQLGPSRR